MNKSSLFKLWILLLALCTTTISGCSSSSDKKVNSRIVDLASLPSNSLIQIGEGRIQQVAYSPDGHQLAVATSRSVILFDAQTWQKLKVILLVSWANNVSWSPDGKLLAVTMLGEIHLYDVVKGTKRQTLKNDRNLSIGEVMEWSPDGKKIASMALVGYSSEMQIWNVDTGKRSSALINANWFAHAEGVSWSPNGDRIAVSYRYSPTDITDKTKYELYIWAISKDGSTNIVRQWDTSNIGGGQLKWLPDNQGILLLGNTIQGYSGISLFSPEDGNLVLHLQLREQGLRGFTWSSSRNQIVVGCYYCDPFIVDLSNLQVIKTLPRSTIGAEFLSLSPSADHIVLANGLEDGFIVFDLQTARELKRIYLHSTLAGNISWSPDSKLIAVGGGDNRVRIYSSSTGEQKITIGDWPPSHLALAEWSSDGKWLASLRKLGKGDSGIVQIWSTNIWQEVKSIPVKIYNTHIAWAPDEVILAIDTANDFMLIRVNEKYVEQVPDEEVKIRSSPFNMWSPDGKKILGVSYMNGGYKSRNGKLIITLVETGERLFSIEDSEIDYVRDTSWSADGTMIAASFDSNCQYYCGGIKIWSAVDGSLIRSFGKFSRFC